MKHMRTGIKVQETISVKDVIRVHQNLKIFLILNTRYLTFTKIYTAVIILSFKLIIFISCPLHAQGKCTLSDKFNINIFYGLLTITVLSFQIQYCPKIVCTSNCNQHINPLSHYNSPFILPVPI